MAVLAFAAVLGLPVAAPAGASTGGWPTVLIPHTAGHEGSSTQVSGDGSPAATFCREPGSEYSNTDVCVTDLATGTTEVVRPRAPHWPAGDAGYVTHDLSDDGETVLLEWYVRDGTSRALVLWDRTTDAVNPIVEWSGDGGQGPNVAGAEMDGTGSAVVAGGERLLGEEHTDEQVYRWDPDAGLRVVPIPGADRVGLDDASDDLSHLAVTTRPDGVHHLLAGDGPPEAVGCWLALVTDDGAGPCLEVEVVAEPTDPRATEERRTTLRWRSAAGDLTELATTVQWQSPSGWWGQSLDVPAVGADGTWLLWTVGERCHGCTEVDGKRHHLWRPGWPTSAAEWVRGSVQDTSADGRVRAMWRGDDDAAVVTVPVPVFLDVPGDHRFVDGIRWLAEEGYTTGYGDGTYRPTRPVSRQALVAFLWRLAGSPVVAGDDTFADVGPNHPFGDAIAWAREAGLVDGYADGTFRGGAPVSRQALAALLWRSAGSPDAASAPFPDVGRSHRFGDAIAWLAEEGLTTGYDDGTFRPTSAVSRQAAAAVLHRAHGADGGASPGT